MEFRLLNGPLEVYSGAGEPVALAGRRQRCVLGVLLMSAPQIVPTDRLVDDLWGGPASERFRTSLHRFVSDVRHALGASASRLRTVPGGYVFDAGAGELDVRRFEQLAQQGRQVVARNPGMASSMLSSALGLWGASPFEDVLDVASLTPELTRLTEVRALAVEDRIEADLTLGRHRELVGELRLLVAEHPLREQYWRQLLIALYRAGRQGEALQAYQALQRLLSTEFDIEPGTELREVEHMVRSHDPALVWSPPHKGRKDNLPRGLGPFVGRASALSSLHQLLAEEQLVTLCGPGGIGKSRLAVEAGASAVDRFAAGAWLVDLATVTEPAGIPIEIARVFGIPEPLKGELMTEIRHHVSDKELLLVLDGCEQVIDQIAPVVQTLMFAAPDLRILVTSREPLRLPGETVLRVHPLEVPPPGEDATPETIVRNDSGRLFIELAAAHRRNFDVTDDNAEAIARVCRRLDGIPLAIELAVARTTSMDVHDMAERLADRLPLLTEGKRTAPPHHRTMEQALDWSYQLLTPSEKALLSRLSVFAGSFTLEAVEAICSDDQVPTEQVAGELGRLVDKSLVIAGPTTHRVRFRLLGTVRDYASKKSVEGGEPDLLDVRYRGWYLDLAERAFGRLPTSARWHAVISDEFDNLRAVYEAYRLNGTTEACLRLAAALYWFMAVSGHVQEGAEWIDAALAAARVDQVSPRVLAVGLAAAGSLAATRGKHDRANTLLGESLERFTEIDHARGMAWSHLLMARAALARAAYPAAVEHSEQAIRLASGAGDALHTAYALLMNAAAAVWPLVPDAGNLSDEEYERVLSGCAEASELCESAALAEVTAETELVRGLIVGVCRDGDEGLSIARAALDELRKYGEGAILADASVAAGVLALHAREPDLAGRLIADGLAISSKSRYAGGVAAALEGLAALRALEGRYATSAILHGASARHPRGGVIVLPLDGGTYQELAQRELGQAAYQLAEEEGMALSLGEAIACAIGRR